MDQDEKQSDRYAFQLWQGGMGMPERDYYVGTSDESKGMLAKYKEHVAKMLERLIGDSLEAAKGGAEVVVADRDEAGGGGRARRRARFGIGRRTTTRKIWRSWRRCRRTWIEAAYLVGLDVKPVEYVVVGQPEFLKRVEDLTASVPIEQWRTYLRWQLLHSFAPGGKIELENFRFFGQVMRCQDAAAVEEGDSGLDDNMGERRLGSYT